MLRGVFGVGGCGRGIMPIVRLQWPKDELVFVDDGERETVVNGFQVMSFDTFCARGGRGKAITLAIAEPTTRMRLAEKCKTAGLSFFDARAANVVEMDDVLIGVGALLSPGVILTSNIRIGDHFHANLNSYVEHDCIIGDFVTFAPGVKCNGNVHVEDYAYIGSGAILKQGLRNRPLVIGSGAVIGMGAVVTKDVPPRATVVGNPARPLAV